VRRLTKSFDPERLRHLPDLQLRAAWLVDGLLAGMHSAQRFGASLEFAQHRAYSPGDDTGAIDWRAFGRTDRLFIKQTHDETAVTVHLLLDTTPSLAFRGERSPISKLEFAQLITLGLAYLVLRQGDSVQLGLIDLRQSRWLPTMRGELGWQQLLAALEAPAAGRPLASEPPQPFTEGLTTLIQQLSGRRSGWAIIVSDFLDEPDHLGEPLARLCFERYRCWLVQVTDPDESQLPDQGPCRLIDLEDGRHLELDPDLWRDAYAEQWALHQNRLSKVAVDHQSALWSFSSNTSPIEALVHLMGTTDRGGR
jgi:uncharacterized protein (DUF58 family)